MAPSEGIEPPVQEPESYVLSITPRGQLNTKKSTHSRLYEKHDVDNPHFFEAYPQNSVPYFNLMTLTIIQTYC